MLKRKYQGILKAIYKKFGRENQLRKLHEECIEFLAAHERYKKNAIPRGLIISLMKDEIVDVFIVVTQFFLSDAEFRELVYQKIDFKKGRLL